MLCAPVLTLPARESDISSVSWSPDGHMIASGHQDGSVSVWDVATGTEYRRMASHNGRVTQVSWSADGYHIATASADGTIRLWDAETGHPLQAFAGRRDAIHLTTWSSEGVKIVRPRSSDSSQDEVTEDLYYDGELPTRMLSHFPTADAQSEYASQEFAWLIIAFIAAAWFCLFGVIIAG
jgi:WD40 repeat protein